MSARSYAIGDLLVAPRREPVPEGWNVTATGEQMWRIAEQAGVAEEDTRIVPPGDTRVQDALEAVFDEYGTEVAPDLLYALAVVSDEQTAAELRRIADELLHHDTLEYIAVEALLRRRASELDGRRWSSAAGAPSVPRRGDVV
jgi:hypothetical protein